MTSEICLFSFSLSAVFCVPKFFCPSLLVCFVLTFLSYGICHFSFVIRHTDSSLLPSDTTQINFPALSHLGGPLSGLAPCSTRTHLHTHTHLLFHSLSSTQSLNHTDRRAKPLPDSHTHSVHTHSQSKQWFTTSLFSNVLLASSLLLPFVTADRPWQQHISILPLSSLSAHAVFHQPDLLRSSQFLSILGRKTWGYKHGIHTDAL